MKNKEDLRAKYKLPPDAQIPVVPQSSHSQRTADKEKTKVEDRINKHTKDAIAIKGLI